MGKRMIPDEIKCAIFDFTQRAKEIPNLLSATLFGSVITGDLSKKSDIDISLLFDTDHNPELGVELKTALKIGTEITKDYGLAHSFSFICTNIRDIGENEIDFLWNLEKEGVVIWQKENLFLNKDISKHLKPKLIVSYSLKGLSAKDKSRVHRTIYGYKMKNKIGNKVYEIEKQGLIADNNQRLAPGTILLDLDVWDMLERIFEKLRVRYVKYKIWQEE
jgi:predicted nucleotidyltransferase